MPPESVVRWSLHPRLLTPLANVNVNARSMPATTCRGQGNSPRQSEIPALVEHGLREGGHERVPAEGGGEGVSPREFGAGAGGLYWQREQQVRRSWGEHWAAWASQAAPRLGGGTGDTGACGPRAEVQPGLGPCCRAGIGGPRCVTHRRGPSGNNGGAGLHGVPVVKCSFKKTGV